AVGDVADQPVAGGADRDAHEAAPDEPRQAAEREEQQRPGQLLPAPRALEEAVERIRRRDGILARLPRRREVEAAVQVPQVVAPPRLAVREVVVAPRLVLLEVAGVVQAEEAERPREPD